MPKPRYCYVVSNSANSMLLTLQTEDGLGMFPIRPSYSGNTVCSGWGTIQLEWARPYNVVQEFELAYVQTLSKWRQAFACVYRLYVVESMVQSELFSIHGLVFHDLKTQEE
ncbi:hypothetical protein AVEN_60796-1 [Araneus ventricosus]|uniref:Uncharacterized protein n=1 Tax=Araneus ventricosus TaxID=182803 RepID=A0A4Y2VJU1_ARAVE|nr:hypothetical protein AVEN_60796-1 [Araneus ventricosus]